jgi:hypothetical protein
MISFERNKIEENGVEKNRKGEHREEISGDQGWQVLPMAGFNHCFNPGLNRVGQNSKNPVTVGKTGQLLND